MKYKVWTEEVKKDKEVYFKLTESSSGIELIACDDEGNRLCSGNILNIIPGTGIVLDSGVNNDIDLPLDERGCVEVCK